MAADWHIDDAIMQYVDALRLGDLARFKEIEVESRDWWFPTLDRGAGAALHFAADHGQVLHGHAACKLLHQMHLTCFQRNATTHSWCHCAAGGGPLPGGAAPGSRQPAGRSVGVDAAAPRGPRRALPPRRRPGAVQVRTSIWPCALIQLVVAFPSARANHLFAIYAGTCCSGGRTPVSGPLTARPALSRWATCRASAEHGAAASVRCLQFAVLSSRWRSTDVPVPSCAQGKPCTALSVLDVAVEKVCTLKFL